MLITARSSIPLFLAEVPTLTSGDEVKTRAMDLMLDNLALLAFYLG